MHSKARVTLFYIAKLITLAHQNPNQDLWGEGSIPRSEGDTFKESHEYRRIGSSGLNLTCEGLLLGMWAGDPTEIPTLRLTLAYRIPTNLRPAVRIAVYLHFFCGIPTNLHPHGEAQAPSCLHGGAQV
jgi:hypothetical protein